MRLEYAARSETGPVRSENQDVLHADPARGLFIVCDGMGGHNAGRLAATIAVEAVCGHIESALDDGLPADDLGDLVVEAIGRANRAIITRAAGDVAVTGMGTTCTLALILDGGRTFMGHVGDSRLYLSRDSGILQLSEDHSYVQELVNCGALKPEEAVRHPQRNIITRALGLADALQVDILDFDLEAGDTLLLCSDGLCGSFEEDASLQSGARDADLVQGLDRMVDQALDAGGKDNITGILVRFPPS